ncbi:collagen adhesion protein [Listeria grandensis FSL F6-0971]|uniref:Collagen adhesion protein n=1 Tax=Listeria grandensis FSL F6-0971 TaxID=1265819 RepID=W7BKD9_9LIST|nr:LPXTG cell wall anchor domain-containing protein [Listeria grandensis]EUJ23676.1 collagen adhesion protein [Listeria grandensis FSL F6-0971]
MKAKKYIVIFMITLLSVQLGTLFLDVKKGQVMAESTGGNASISVITGTIKSRQEVNLHVNVFGSAGDFLEDNGNIVVSIPKEIVYNMGDFNTKMLIPEPFEYEGLEKDDTNFNLIFSMNTELIDANDAFNGVFEIKFGAPIIRVDGEHASIQTFTVSYAGKQQQVRVDVQKQHLPVFPIFDKWYKGDFDQNGIANLNTTNAEANRFQLVVNYRGTELKDVIVSDQLPQGTSLIASSKRMSTPGDSMTKDQIRVLKVTDFDEEGEAIHYKYVTDEFADKIMYDKVANRFSVDFGDIAADETYFVEYSLKIEDSNLGVQMNVANLVASNRQAIEKSVSVQAINHYGTSYVLNESVDKTTLNYDENEVIYTLKLSLLDGEAIPAGTVITDPLNEKMISPELEAYDTSKFDIKIEDNKLTIKLLKDLPKGELAEWSFKVGVENLKMGETLFNQAFLMLASDQVYSNSVSTRKYDGRIQIKKLDNLHNPVSGATYEILNDKNEQVFEGLTDATGLLNSKALQPGTYTVREVTAPVGYILDSTPYYVSVSTADTVPIVLGTENKLKGGSVKLTKIDADNPSVPLAGAKFELHDSDGEVLFTDMSTDINGEIVISGLIPGRYYFIETEAPNGYVLDSTPVSFDIEIGENDTQVQVIKENSREDMKVPPIVSQQPVLPLKPSPPVKAPEVMVSELPIIVRPMTSVTQNPGNERVEINPVIKELPETGDSKRNQMALYGISLMIFALAVLIKRKNG